MQMPYPAHSGGLGRALIERADADSGVEAFCKISENRHDFLRLGDLLDYARVRAAASTNAQGSLLFNP